MKKKKKKVKRKPEKPTLKLKQIKRDNLNPQKLAHIHLEVV